MMLRKIAATAAAAALLAAGPAVAAARPAPAAPADARAGAALEEPSAIEGAGLAVYLIGAAVLALAVWGILELTGGDDEPASP